MKGSLGSSRLETIQALRFLAAFLVVVYHANIFVQDYAPGVLPLIAPETLTRIATIGRSGVPIFFVISGFIMLHTSHDSFGRPGAWGRFARNRIVRIYPLYWMLLAVWLVFVPQSRADVPGDPGALLGVLLLWPGQADRIISVAWTLSYEMYFYVLFAAALFLPRRAGLAAIALAICFGVVLGKVLGLKAALPSGEALYGSELLLFLAGMGIALMARSLAAHPALWSFRLRGLSMAAGLLWLLATPFLRDAGVPALLAYGPAAVILVGASVFSDVTGRTPRLARLFSLAGDSSYSLYLSHILVMILAKPWLVGLATAIGLGPVGLIALLSLVSVLAGLGLYIGFERRVQVWFRQRMSGSFQRGGHHGGHHGGA